MARNKKNGLEWFKVDVQMFDDEKVSLLSSEHGTIGESAYLRLLSKIYRNGYFYPWNNDNALMFNRWAGGIYNMQQLSEVVATCLQRGLFDADVFEKHNVLTSKRIQRQYHDVASKRGPVEINPDIWLLDESEGYPVLISAAEMPISASEMPISASEMLQSRVRVRIRVREEESICGLPSANTPLASVKNDENTQPDQPKNNEEKNNEEKINHFLYDAEYFGNLIQKIFIADRKALTKLKKNFPPSPDLVSPDAQKLIEIVAKKIEERDQFLRNEEKKLQEQAVQQVYDYYQKVASESGLTVSRELTASRQKAIAARIANAGTETVLECITTAGQSPFLTGKTDAGFKAGLDWIMTPKNFQKIIENQYSNSFSNAKQKEIPTRSAQQIDPRSGQKDGYGSW